MVEREEQAGVGSSEGAVPERMVSPGEVLYGLNQRPPFLQTVFEAFQHLLAIFVPIITPALIICGAMGLEPETTRYVVSMSLVISGIATFIQIRRFGPVGTGLLSIQGTSFSFVSTLIAVGQTGGLSLIFGVCLAGSVIEMLISRTLVLVRRVITPLVSGIVVTLIGLTLIKAGVFNCAGGAAAVATGTYGSARNLVLALFVMAVIVAFNRSRSPYVRMSSIVIGLAAGYGASAVMGMIDFSPLKGLDRVVLPVPFRFGLSFSWSAFIPVALLYAVTAVETMGDVTATCMVSGEPIAGPLYLRRLSGGMLADGLNSLLAAAFNTFPNTTFSQNNGIILLTGVASRYVGYFIAGMLVLLGLLPHVAGVFAMMPAPVLGGATLLMFGTVAAAGIRVLAAEAIDRRAVTIIAVSLSLGLSVVVEPDLLKQFPAWVGNVFGSGIVTGAGAAILCSMLLRRTDSALSSDV